MKAFGLSISVFWALPSGRFFWSDVLSNVTPFLHTTSMLLEGFYFRPQRSNIALSSISR